MCCFYGHYDVQPVDPLELWETPPFEPRIAEGPDGRKRIVARGAADDKGQVMTFIEACRAWKEVTGSLPVDISILVEGAEEDGSKHLPEFVEAHREELTTDLVLVCDTGMWDPQTPAITVGLRGLVYREVIVRAADRDLHSGMFGGAARNPIHLLSRIIADLHDEDGRVTLDGFYDGVEEPPEEIKAQWRELGLEAEDFLGPHFWPSPQPCRGEKGAHWLTPDYPGRGPPCDRAHEHHTRTVLYPGEGT